MFLNHLGENVPLVMLIKKRRTKLTKIQSKKNYKYITSMMRLKDERKYIKMRKSGYIQRAKVQVSFLFFVYF